MLAVGGGMAVQRAVAERWQQATGNVITQGYGLTEASPVVTTNPVGSPFTGAVGLAVPSTQITIRDDDGVVLPVGEIGEICVRGPQVMKGYWNKPAENNACFRDGYFMTGDIGIMKEDGFFKIVDRKKEMINVSGLKVFPNDVENAIALHPGVLEVGVRGDKDKHGNELVMAFVVKKDPSLTENDVIEFCRINLTAYKVPKKVVFRDELPKSNVGKILRRLLE
ncbi:MAG: long-chain acyl-CoA synthetase [Bacteroidia bacterium]